MKVLPANRVAALAAGFTGLAQIGTALAGVWPSAATNKIALIAGTLSTLAPAIAHQIGSMFWDRTPAGQAAGFKRQPVESDHTRVVELESQLASVRAALGSRAAADSTPTTGA